MRFHLHWPIYDLRGFWKCKVCKGRVDIKPKMNSTDQSNALQIDTFYDTQW